jgi:hypothetical protein
MLHLDQWGQWTRKVMKGEKKYKHVRVELPSTADQSESQKLQTTIIY